MLNRIRLTWSALLGRQYLLLIWCAGIFASRFFLPGLTAAALLAMLCFIFKAKAISASKSSKTSYASDSCLPAHNCLPSDNCLTANNCLTAGEARLSGGNEFGKNRSEPAICIILCLLAFSLGLGYAKLREPAQKTPPAWAIEASTPDEHSAVYKKGLTVRAVVAEVNGRSDQRLELILREAQPVSPKTPEPPKLPGRLVLTRLDQPVFATGNMQTPGPEYWTEEKILEQRPIPGQEIELALKIKRIHGLKNPGLWDIESYWSDREIWHRALINTAPAAVGQSVGQNTGQNTVQHAGDSYRLGAPPAGLAFTRENLRLRAMAALPRNASGLMPGANFIPALLFGDSYFMNSQDSYLLAAATLSHSLAISGLHLGYAAALGYIFAQLVFYCFPRIGLHLPRRRFSACCAFLPALMYIWIGGGTPSLIRAGLMLFFCGLLLFLKKPAVLLDGLLLAVLIILLAHPQTMFDIRLQLSALAMAAIALISPVLSWFAAWFRVQFNNRFMPQANGKYGKAHKCAHYLLEGMVMLTCTSLAVQIALMPVLSNAFVGVGVAFPLNLLWLPVLGMLVMPAAFLGLLATALNLSWFAQLCFQIAAYPCAWLMDFLRWLQGLELLPVIFPIRPHWLFILGLWFILSILPLFCMHLANRASLRLPGVLIALGLLLCLLPTGLRAYEQSRDAVRLRLIDVGQGQAILLEYPGGKRLLLDGGGVNNGRLSSSSFDIGKDVITATLLDNRPAHLDYMLASHPDYDHIQGLIHPLTHLQVDYFADNGAPYSNDLSHARLLDILQRKQYAQNSLYAGQTLTLNSASGSDYGELRLEVLHPQNTTAYTDKSNNQSLVVRLVWRGKPLALLCGDAENKAQREILKHYAAQDLKAQVLVLPHHGSKGASLKAFYKAVAPELALASCAYGNRWFFPAEKTRQNLNDLGIKLMSTSEYGQIIIEWEGEDAKMSVTAARE